MDAFESARALFFEGLRHLQSKDYAAAEEKFGASLVLVPGRISTMNNLSLALINLHKYSEARRLIADILIRDQNSPEAWLNLGLIEREERFDPALALQKFERALAIRSDYAEAHLNRAISLGDLKRHDEALDGFARALAIDPTLVEAYNCRAITLREMKRYVEATESYDAAMKLDPDYDYLIGSRLHAKLQLCDWSGIDDDLARIARKIEQGKKAASPFQMLGFTDDPVVLRKGIEIWARDKVGAGGGHRSLPKRAPTQKIRIGYYSADIRTHPVATLIAGMIEHHDRECFDIVCFSYGPAGSGELRDRLVRGFDALHDVGTLSDAEVAQLSRDQKIDIAVDLTGYTQYMRPGMFALGCAPIQVSYLGYAATTGTEAMDYIVADHTLIPEAARAHYSEKIAYLPDSYQPNDDRRPISDKVFSRAELSLPENAFVFCCFNTSNKITPPTFTRWMRILKQVPGGVLWFRRDREIVTENLRRAAQNQGVDPERMIFAGRLEKMDEHLARYRAADLFLDTLPFNAHTTASDALWAGLPVLTCPGGTLASRVAASLLRSIGLAELVTVDGAAYEKLAVELARDSQRLTGIRRKLAENRLSAPLFQTAQFTKYIEDAYGQMYQRYHADAAPDHIFAGPSARPEAAKVTV